VPFVRGRDRLGPDATAVPPDDLLHRGQADAGAGKLVRAVQPLERAPTSTRAPLVRAVNFQALPSRFCSTSRSSVASPSARRLGATTKSTARVVSCVRRSSASSRAIWERSTRSRFSSRLVVRDKPSRVSIIVFIRWLAATMRRR
jgi:hypothetical protein